LRFAARGATVASGDGQLGPGRVRRALVDVDPRNLGSSGGRPYRRVAVGLVRRVVVGDAPDGTVYGGEPLISGTRVSLDVELREALGTRPLIDASTGDAVPRVERTSGQLHPAEALGTPRWIPA
jgi:hypothetical protein